MAEVLSLQFVLPLLGKALSPDMGVALREDQRVVHKSAGGSISEGPQDNGQFTAARSFHTEWQLYYLQWQQQSGQGNLLVATEEEPIVECDEHGQRLETKRAKS
ncbi:unnamed protein product [Pleuronectes platessa]|uniref:Uncharacterized protein n=1 Tax=Pleuronectes platessa TaxID=8262 RepID=A0A9N7TI43_PLEPL|nr:unnamed protein product [Pleuronectes platessa]